MGNCLNVDVKSKYAVGEVASRNPDSEGAAAAVLASSLANRTWVELSLRCTDLKHADLLSKTDPMGILYCLQNGAWMEVGRTEMIANQYHPSFVQRFRVLYHFELVQKFRLLLVDIDKGQNPATVNPDSCKFLGTYEFDLGEVVAARDRKYVRPLADRDGKPGKSTMTLIAEEQSGCKDTYRIRLQAQNLQNVELLGRSDPFLEISRWQDDNSTLLPVYKTETRKNNLSPAWNEICVRATQLNYGDVNRPLRIRVYDYEANGSHRMLGFCDVTTQKLREMAQQHGAVISLQPPPGKGPGSYGTLQVLSFQTEMQPTFLDYVTSGTEIGFVAAVDFTGSNGDPNLPHSKHYVFGGPTQYELAIMGIGQVIMHYDYDKMFPAFGFGGRKAWENVTNHCFPLGDSPDGTCVGVVGLLEGYRKALREWSLSGPTYFAPVIRKAASMAAESLQSGGMPKYTCLLILTDGEVTDMDATVEAIVEASGLPLSILIVGIGNDNFTKMKTLDSDQKRLTSSTGRVAVRDIVQFVEFNKFACDQSRLAQELLAELPGQLVEYFMGQRILPRYAPVDAGPAPMPASFAAA
ncbi:hypothetical protein Agub_g1900 [Astrephomene gubernaculifera]|uniref:C2 domain-containing protein n=1 Tax=Astrephomene gubernaculifera TaxID=47775 RepID=A0AAD3HHP2_9CHLO|nr:hypothetical protein Agub_g1900 [Astrephomene gubernaculifera]